MPAITLDIDARVELEEYYWRGNIRQLKNVAEQISAVESARMITTEILRRYLPGPMPKGANIISRDGGANASQRESNDGFSTERELLYKVLFDMRSEIGELRRMVAQLLPSESYATNMSSSTMGVTPNITPAAALPAHETQPTPLVGLISAPNNDEANIVESYAEEVEEEREMTKADMQRELITRALKRHNGRRRDAAAELFMSERTLYRRIKELGIEEL